MKIRDFHQALEAAAQPRRPVRLWLRDDDATHPSGALDTMLSLTGRRGVPVALAVIPAGTGADLVGRLAVEPGVSVAVHGWAHANHAGPGEKKQELGLHRPLDAVMEELARGLGHLRALHGRRLVPLLVPPWNRIAPAVVEGLPSLGYRALSTFGPARPTVLPVVNTHVDLIDWRGTGRAKDLPTLLAEIAAALHLGEPVGVLTHHLIHDAAAWSVLEHVLALTAGRPGVVWAGLPALLDHQG